MTPDGRPNDRADGYMTSVAYTYDYHRELNPLHMRLALLAAGIAPPEVATACELGCGQGISLAIHAAASPTRWFGTDVNPEHVAFARTLADAAGVDIRLMDDAFADFAVRADLPAFDFVALHGVWSWISEQNRRTVVEFVGRHLKPGGVFFLSYNALPGSASFGPVRHVLAQHAERTGGQRDVAGRVEAAIAFGERLAAAGAAYLQDNPRDAARLARLRQEDARYLAHEYFGRDWTPMHFADVAACLADAGLGFACTASPFETLDALNLEPEQHAILTGIDDPVFRQTVRDFLVNQRFRRDYWVRDARRLSPAERADGLRDTRLVLAAQRLELPREMRAVLALNPRAPRAGIVSAIAGLFADRRARPLGEVEKALPDVPFERIVEAVMLLIGYDRLAPAQDDATARRVRPHTDRLNACLFRSSTAERDLRHFASPLTGGGVRVRRAHIPLLTMTRGGAGLDERAEAGTEDAAVFARDVLPVLKALGVT